MKRDEIRATLMACLSDVAPEIAEEEVEDDVDIRDELDLDSMDILRWVQGIHKALGVEIPEEDYGKMTSLGDAIDYVAGRI
ncbi:MAG: phosphopantetheine-binding protein [Myxococcales bacterium]|nr:phosphopantetheine-binding protein [Myxococcales bacterium]MDH3485231.1 phosphopantetheine-binding protein [Myxococcales bacterium]